MRQPGASARLAGAFLALLVPARLHSQASPAIEKLALQAARDVENTHPKTVLIAPQEGCLLLPDLCAQFESELQDDLERSQAGTRFITRGELIQQVTSRGLLAVDAYDKQVLLNLASNAGAETLEIVSLVWADGHYELRSYTSRASTGQITKQRLAKVSTSLSGDDPLVYPDPESGISLIIPKRKTGGFPVFRFPECESCRMPDPWKPSGPLEFATFLLTVSETGAVEHIAVTSASGQKAAQAALQALETWRYRPAIDSTGKPFAARISVTVNLTQPPCPQVLPEHGDAPRVTLGAPGAGYSCHSLPPVMSGPSQVPPP